MTVPSLYIYECLKYIRSEATPVVTNADVHSYNTRRRDNIRPDFKRLKKSRNGINYFAAKFYNAIEERVRVLPANVFLRIMKQHLIRESYYSLDEFLNARHDFDICVTQCRHV